jgi:hypothetical protein
LGLIEQEWRSYSPWAETELWRLQSGDLQKHVETKGGTADGYRQEACQALTTKGCTPQAPAGMFSFVLIFFERYFHSRVLEQFVIFLANSDSPLEVRRNVSCFTSFLSWRVLPSPCQQCHYLLPVTSDEAHNRPSTFASTSTVFCVFPLLAPLPRFKHVM